MTGVAVTEIFVHDPVNFQLGTSRKRRRFSSSSWNAGSDSPASVDGNVGVEGGAGSDGGEAVLADAGDDVPASSPVRCTPAKRARRHLSKKQRAATPRSSAIANTSYLSQLDGISIVSWGACPPDPPRVLFLFGRVVLGMWGGVGGRHADAGVGIGMQWWLDLVKGVCQRSN